MHKPQILAGAVMRPGSRMRVWNPAQAQLRRTSWRAEGGVDAQARHENQLPFWRRQQRPQALPGRHVARLELFFQAARQRAGFEAEAFAALAWVHEHLVQMRGHDAAAQRQLHVPVPTPLWHCERTRLAVRIDPIRRGSPPTASRSLFGT